MNTSLIILLIALGIPGIIVTARSFTKTLAAVVEKKDPDKIPSTTTLRTAHIAQSVVLLVAAVVGGYLAGESLGLAEPLFLSAFAHGQFLLGWLLQSFTPYLLILVSTAVFLALYYGLFRRILDSKTVHATETMRTSLGYVGRLLYGGVNEEILIRYGALNFFAWIVITVFDTSNELGFWLPIVLAALIFSIMHIPSALAVGAQKSSVFYAAVLVLNGLVGITYGYLTLQFGLAFAILGHVLLHAVWHPIELRYSKR